MASTMNSEESSMSVEEYTIRVPKSVTKKHHVMKFNASLDIKFSKWTNVSMGRENNMGEIKRTEEELPKFGAGSEFGREAKEDIRRKKLGIVEKKYNADNQPWLLTSYESTAKKFKSLRLGGISDNSAYYIFTHGEDGAINAFPLHDWYTFQPIQRFKALSVEEAETEFDKREKHINYFSLMLKKRLKGEEDSDLDENEENEEKGKETSSTKVKELKISEMDEWMESSNDDSSEEDDKEERDKTTEKNKIKKSQPKKYVKKNNFDQEAFEDSDDGDEEGRELDYISDSSDSEPENTKLEGVSEEKGLRKLLNSDDESDSSSDEDSDIFGKKQVDEDELRDKEEDEKKETVDKKKFSNTNEELTKGAPKKKEKKEKIKKESCNSNEGLTKGAPKKKEKNEKIKKESCNTNEGLTKGAPKKKEKNEKIKKESCNTNKVLKSCVSEKTEKKDNIEKMKATCSVQRSGNRMVDSDALAVPNAKMGEEENIVKKDPHNANSSRFADIKRKLVDDALASPSPKKVKLDLPSSSSYETGLTDDAVRKYLTKKPMTTTDLLEIFKPKTTGTSGGQLIVQILKIIRRISPIRQTINGKTYFSIKS